MSPLGRQQVVRRVPFEPLLPVYGGRLDPPSSRRSRAIITAGATVPQLELVTVECRCSTLEFTRLQDRALDVVRSGLNFLFA
jgi:hypothetical protein